MTASRPLLKLKKEDHPALALIKTYSQKERGKTHGDKADGKIKRV